MAVNNLSIYLMKRNEGNFRNYLRKADDVICKKVDIEDAVKAQFFYCKSKITTPLWMQSFFADSLKSVTEIQSATASALLFISVKIEEEKKTFCLSFGHGYCLLTSDSYVADFGMRISKRLLNAERVSRVDVTSFESVSKRKSIQATRSTDFKSFFLDDTKDYIKSLSGHSGDEIGLDALKQRLITGSSSLNISANVDIKSISEVLIELYKEYSGKKEDTIVFNSNYKPINDPHIIDSAKKEIVKKIVADDSNVYLAYPGIFDASLVTSYVLHGDEDNTEFETFDLSEIKDKITKTENPLDNLSIAYKKDDGEEDKIMGTVFQLLCADVQIDGKCYTLDSGNLYYVENDLVALVNKSYDNISAYHGLKKTGEFYDEDAFNKCISKDENRLLMDKKFVIMGTKAKLELCDVLTKDHYLLCVKCKWNATAIGHLCDQISHAVRLLNSKLYTESIDTAVKEAVEWNNNQDDRSKVEENTFKIDYDNLQQYKFVIVILEHHNAKSVITDEYRPKLSFFAKLSVMNCVNIVHNLGLDVQICTGLEANWIRRSEGEKENAVQEVVNGAVVVNNVSNS